MVNVVAGFQSSGRRARWPAVLDASNVSWIGIISAARYFP
jgi:hypothetical protein